MTAVSDDDISRAPWRKSSYSGNGNDCVEVAAWRKASYSGNGGNCVEAGVAEAGRVLVRDTTDRAGGTLSFPAAAWRVFASGLMRP
jgi:Domain of unknown function (DUF397)